MTRIILFLLFLFPLSVAAQTWPEHRELAVNDYAAIIDDVTEARLRDAIETLRADTGIELTVLTLTSRDDYWPGASLEDFATGLFNAWGIGNSERNDGILVLVLSGDRDMRIELGAGYSTGYDNTAKRIIDNDFLPAFRQGDYSGGIETGTGAVIEKIALRKAAGQEPVETAPPGGAIIGTAIAVVGLLITLVTALLVFGRPLFDRLRRCPSCGQRGLHLSRKVIRKPGRKTKGRGEKTLECDGCGYRSVTPYTIAATSDSSSSGGSFGGGSSSGGGASGSW